MEATQAESGCCGKCRPRRRATSFGGWVFGTYVTLVVVTSVLMLLFGIVCCVFGGFITPTADTVPILVKKIAAFRCLVLYSVLLTVLACLMIRNCLLGLPMALAAVIGTFSLAAATWKISLAGGFLPGWNFAGISIAKANLAMSSFWIFILALFMVGMFFAWIGVHVYQGYYNLRTRWIKWRRRQQS